jgi:hypothetical protein
MKKYFIEYSGKDKEVIADRYYFDDLIIYFTLKDIVVFAVNKNLLESVSVATEELNYTDIDLSKVLTDNLAAEYTIDDKDEYYKARLNVYYDSYNSVSQSGEFNKKYFPNERKVKNKLTQDFIINAIKSHLKSV